VGGFEIEFDNGLVTFKPERSQVRRGSVCLEVGQIQSGSDRILSPATYLLELHRDSLVGSMIPIETINSDNQIQLLASEHPLPHPFGGIPHLPFLGCHRTALSPNMRVPCHISTD